MPALTADTGRCQRRLGPDVAEASAGRGSTPRERGSGCSDRARMRGVALWGYCGCRSRGPLLNELIFGVLVAGILGPIAMAMRILEAR